MERNQLISSAVELGLDLIDKNGTFVPFCKAVSESGETFVYTAASDTGFTAEQAYESVSLNVKRDLVIRRLKGVAYCFHSRVRLVGSTEKVPAVELEIHYQGFPAEIWYFLYKTEKGRATILQSYTNPAKENLFA
jgi:hypothetical protein